MSTPHLTALRSRLSHLARLEADSDWRDQRIHALARARLDSLTAEINRLAPRVLYDQSDAGDRYQDMIAERAALERVLALP